MAGSGEILARHARVQLTVDGVRLGGSFSTIHDITVKPDANINKKQFTGEKRFRADLVINGWDVNFKTEKRDHTWSQLWDIIQDAELNDRPLPVIVMTLSYKYRDGSGILRTVTLSGDFMLKMDEDNIPVNGYQGNSWSGACSYNSSSQS